MKKNGVICLVSMFPSSVMVPKLSKMCILCNFVLTSARNLSLLKQFTKYASERSCYTLLENGIVYCAIVPTVSEILVFEIKEFC